MKKKNLAVALLIAMSIAVVGCGKAKEPEMTETVAIEASTESTSEPKQETQPKTSSEEKTEAAAEKSDELSVKVEETKESSEEKLKADTEKKDKDAEQQKAQLAEQETKEEEPKKQEPAPQPEQPDGYGRILCCGDSRTVDMFSEPLSEIRNEIHDGIPVYCKDGCKYEYMVNAIDEYGLDNFDTLVSWMGCNNYGDFSQYGPYYDQLLSQGKKLVLCTVGPTVDQYLDGDFDKEYYTNQRQINYNNSLKAWAKDKDVKVIDMYAHIDNAMNNSGGIIINPTDGIHYYPQPNPDLWNYILSNLK